MTKASSPEKDGIGWAVLMKGLFAIESNVFFRKAIWTPINGFVRIATLFLFHQNQLCRMNIPWRIAVISLRLKHFHMMKFEKRIRIQFQKLFPA